MSVCRLLLPPSSSVMDFTGTKAGDFTIRERLFFWGNRFPNFGQISVPLITKISQLNEII